MTLNSKTLWNNNQRALYEIIRTTEGIPCITRHIRQWYPWCTYSIDHRHYSRNKTDGLPDALIKRRYSPNATLVHCGMESFVKRSTEPTSKGNDYERHLPAATTVKGFARGNRITSQIQPDQCGDRLRGWTEKSSTESEGIVRVSTTKAKKKTPTYQQQSARRQRQTAQTQKHNEGCGHLMPCLQGSDAAAGMTGQPLFLRFPIVIMSFSRIYYQEHWACYIYSPHKSPRLTWMLTQQASWDDLKRDVYIVKFTLLFYHQRTDAFKWFALPRQLITSPETVLSTETSFEKNYVVR